MVYSLYNTCLKGHQDFTLFRKGIIFFRAHELFYVSLYFSFYFFPFFFSLFSPSMLFHWAMLEYTFFHLFYFIFEWNPFIYKQNKKSANLLLFNIIFLILEVDDSSSKPFAQENGGFSNGVHTQHAIITSKHAQQSMKEVLDIIFFFHELVL